jgi:hypothetical protein
MFSYRWLLYVMQWNRCMTLNAFQCCPLHLMKILKCPEACLLNRRLMLSSSFRCDEIHKYEVYGFGNTLLSYLSQTYDVQWTHLCSIKAPKNCFIFFSFFRRKSGIFNRKAGETGFGRKRPDGSTDFAFKPETRSIWGLEITWKSVLTWKSGLTWNSG